MAKKSAPPSKVTPKAVPKNIPGAKPTRIQESCMPKFKNPPPPPPKKD
jgi:hypothetical protein